MMLELFEGKLSKALLSWTIKFNVCKSQKLAIEIRMWKVVREKCLLIKAKCICIEFSWDKRANICALPLLRQRTLLHFTLIENKTLLGKKVNCFQLQNTITVHNWIIDLETSFTYFSFYKTHTEWCSCWDDEDNRTSFDDECKGRFDVQNRHSL